MHISISAMPVLVMLMLLCEKTKIHKVDPILRIFLCLALGAKCVYGQYNATNARQQQQNNTKKINGTEKQFIFFCSLAFFGCFVIIRLCWHLFCTNDFAESNGSNTASLLVHPISRVTTTKQKKHQKRRREKKSVSAFLTFLHRFRCAGIFSMVPIEFT